MPYRLSSKAKQLWDNANTALSEVGEQRTAFSNQ
jgi:hypothetical protein